MVRQRNRRIHVILSDLRFQSWMFLKKRALNHGEFEVQAFFEANKHSALYPRQSINQLINQSIKQTIKQSINQSINQLIDRIYLT